MPKLNPNEGAAKWATRTKAAVPDAVAGVNRVTENPAQKAIAKLDKMMQRFIESVQSGKVERGLARVTLQSWKERTAAGMQQRIASGVDGKGKDKMAEFTSEFYPFLERLEAEIAQMPDTTLEDNIGRMVANVRGISEFKRSQ